MNIGNISEFKSILLKYKQDAVNNKIVVYTANFNNYDKLKKPLQVSKANYICFHDKKSKVPEGWKGILVEEVVSDFFIWSRAFKILSHLLFNNSVTTLYVDSSFLFKRTPERFIQAHCQSPISFFKHPSRESIFEELEACIAQKKGNVNCMERFVDENFLTIMSMKSKLLSAGVIFRKDMSIKEKLAMEQWFQYILEGVSRDQIALPVALNKHSIQPHVIPIDIFYNHYLVPNPHKNSSIYSRFHWQLGQFAWSIMNFYKLFAK